MDKPWKLVLALIGIFIAGSVTGGFVSLRIAKERVQQRRPMPEQWGPQRLKALGKELALTPDQMDKIRPIIRRDTDELNKLRQGTMEKTRDIFIKMERDIAQHLTPEQRAKYEQMLKERRAREQRMIKEGRPMRGEYGPGGGQRPMRQKEKAKVGPPAQDEPAKTAPQNPPADPPKP